MPRRYNGAIYKDSVGALLQQQAPGGFAGSDRRRKSGGRVKNYSLDNRANIKEIQAQNRQRKQEEEAPAAEPFKLRQFKNVKSRFSSSAPTASEGSSAAGSAEPTGTGRHFLRRGSREKVATELRQEVIRRRREDEATAAATSTVTATATSTAAGSGSRKSIARTGSLSEATGAGAAPVAPSSGAAPSWRDANSRGSSGNGSSGGRNGGMPSSNRREGGAGVGAPAAEDESTIYRWRTGGVTPKKEAVPKAAEVARLAPRSSRDFVTANRVQATEMKARNVPDEGERFTHDSYGRVPDYLVSRQEEWEREAERRRAEAPDPSCPPGMKLMPEEERLKTLGLLQENESACQAQLNKFPLVVQTPLLRRRVEELNEKLKEIDAAKAIFSRARVYIARDS